MFKYLQKKPNITITIVLVIFLLVTFYGCNKSETKTGSNDENTNVEKAENIEKESSSEDEKKTVSNKKIAIVVEDEQKEYLDAVEEAIQFYIDKGYQKDLITKYQLKSNKENLVEITDKIKEEKPDVVQIVPGYPGLTRTQLYEVTDIPLVVGGGAQLNSDENGVPQSNLTGVNAFTDDMPTKVYKLLEQLAPSNGKKAGYLCDPMFPDMKVDFIQSHLDNVNVKLKDPAVVDTYEASIEAAKKYNEDDEIAWILVGVVAMKKEDGSPISWVETNKKVYEYGNKPGGAFFDPAVMTGALCGICVDIRDSQILQPAEMAIEILEGKDVKEIKAQEPRKVNILFNKMTADKLGINIPDDLLSAAYRVYTDYEGNYIGKK